jgi:hypothetical protein
LNRLVTRVREIHNESLSSYDGDDVDWIIRLLRNVPHCGIVAVDPSPHRATSPFAEARSPPPPPLLPSPLSPQVNVTPGNGEPASVAISNRTATSDSGRPSNGTTVTATDVTAVTATTGSKIAHDDGLYPPSSSEKLDSMNGLAHGLHLAGIAMLGFLVLEVGIRRLAAADVDRPPSLTFDTVHKQIFTHGIESCGCAAEIQ